MTLRVKLSMVYDYVGRYVYVFVHVTLLRLHHALPQDTGNNPNVTIKFVIEQNNKLIINALVYIFFCPLITFR
jgi:hypothetical protein